jgi:hypothetical protein
MAALAALDHTVINVHHEMDQAQPLFSALGFTLTPRGYHSLGSINHLMMFGSDYLELIGMPVGADNTRPEILASPIGIDGLVFKTTDVDRTFTYLQAIDMAGDPPRAFTRPVALPGGEATAKFRTVTVRAGVLPAGRVYFCEHGTPELVWRPEWQTHANGVTRMTEVVIVAREPEAETARYARLLDVAEPDKRDDAYRIPLSGAVLSVLSPAQYAARYEDLAASMHNRQSMFGAVVMASDNLHTLASRLKAMSEPVPTAISDDRVTVRVPAFDCLLEFVT